MKHELTFAQRLNGFLGSGYPLLSIETHEEIRALIEVRNVCKARKVRYYEWDAAYGMVGTDLQSTDTSDEPEIIKGTQGVEGIAAMQAKIVSIVPKDMDDNVSTVVVVKDAHLILESRASAIVPVIRRFRNMLVSMKQYGHSIIFISPHFSAPLELQKDITPVEFALPTEAELRTLFNQMIDKDVRKIPEFAKLKIADDVVDAVASAATGMTSIEAENAFSFSMVASKTLRGKLEFDTGYVRIVFEQKIAALENSFLEYVPTRSGFGAVGGLEVLKRWSVERRRGFDPIARELNLPLPKGVLIGGFQGCGKTVSAMAIAYEFGFPLFKLDLGKLFGSKVGETEANTRALICLLEGLGRAVILVDEMEKYMNQGAVSGQGDSGASSRMFGTFLSWMSLKTCPTFFIGTVNDIECMPPALTRRGRFDAVFWVDLPEDAERMQIFNALMEHKFKREFRIQSPRDELVSATKDFSGAEIEALIEDSLYVVLDDKKKADKMLPAVLLEKVKRLVPQAQIDPKKVQEMRNHAEQGFIKANNSGQIGKPVSVSNVSRRMDING